MTPDERRAKIEAVFLEEREEAYALAWRRGLEAIEAHVRYTLGRRKLRGQLVMHAQSAIGLLCGSAESAVRDGVISHTCGELLISIGRGAMTRLTTELKGD